MPEQQKNGLGRPGDGRRRTRVVAGQDPPAALDRLEAGAIDTTAPVISDVVSRRVSKGFEVTWTTNEPANSVTRFSAGILDTFSDANLVTTHRMFFRVKKNTYAFTISSTDAAGNTATSGPYTFQN